MYCASCGTRLTGNEKYCFHCGKVVDKNSNNVTVKTNESNGMKTASIVLGIISIIGIFIIIFSPISLILSLIGLILAIKANKEVSNIPGIVINAISLFISLIITAIFVLIIMFAVNLGRNVDIGNIPWNDIANKIEFENKF